MSGNSYSTYVGRPGILTAVGVFSIVVASIAMFVDFGSLIFASGVWRMATRGAVTPAVAPAAPSVVSPVNREYVAPEGLSAEQRQIVIDGLSQARPLSDARRKQLDGLLADVGRNVIRLSPESLTEERVGSYVTEVREIPDGAGGPADDVFMLGSGRLQISDGSAVFFADNSPSGIRSHGGSYSDSTGTHLAAGQIEAVVDRAQSLCGQAMNDAQVKALEGELESTEQTLIKPSPSVAEAAAQVQSAQTLADATVAVTTDSGSMSFGPTGQSFPGVVAVGAQRAAWGPKRVPRTDATLVTLDALLSFAAAGLLMACGIMTLKNAPLSRWLHIGYAIGKIFLVVLSCTAIYRVTMALEADSPDAGSTAMAWILIVVAPGAIYPFVLLVVMNLRSVREFLGATTVARIF